MAGTIGILNVGAGDIKLTFDKSNVAETIRAGRIVTDMLRRGYALIIEVPDGQGGTTAQRVREFDENTGEYIIADFAPIIEPVAVETVENAPETTAEIATTPTKPGRGKRKIAADSVSGIAIARSAGG